MTREGQLIADYADKTLPLAKACLGDEYFYQSLPLCVIDAVWSLGVKYGAVQNVVDRYCKTSGLRKIRTDRDSLPPMSEQEAIAAFCARVERTGPEKMADEVFENRQRTSSKNGILKAEGVYRFSCALRKHRVGCFQDVPEAASNVALERDIRRIPGQRSGKSLRYFWMLAGSDEFVKPDRWILCFLKSALGRSVSSDDEVQALLQEATQLLQPLHPHLTPRLSDHEIWKYQRDVGGPP
jgi:hypothetical protein